MDQVIGDRRPSLANDRNNLPLVQAAILEALRVEKNMVPMAVPHVALHGRTLQSQSTWIPNVGKTPLSLIRTAILTQKVTWSQTKVIFVQFALVNLAKIELFLFVSWLIHNFTFIAAEGHTPKVKAVFVQFPVCFKIRAIKRWWSVKYKGLSWMKKIATRCFVVFKEIPSYLRR